MRFYTKFGNVSLDMQKVVGFKKSYTYLIDPNDTAIWHPFLCGVDVYVENYSSPIILNPQDGEKFLTFMSNKGMMEYDNDGR